MRLRKQKKVVAVTLATAIAVSTISASASAVSYDLAKGDVTIDQDADRGAFSYQGEDKKENRTYVNEDKEDDGKIPPLRTPSPCKRTSKRPITPTAPKAATWIS